MGKICWEMRKDTQRISVNKWIEGSEAEAEVVIIIIIEKDYKLNNLLIATKNRL